MQIHHAIDYIKQRKELALQIEVNDFDSAYAKTAEHRYRKGYFAIAKTRS